MKLRQLRPEFVEFVPEPLQTGVIYVSMKYSTAAHLCCCRCGKEVVTPFTPTDWKLIFDGRLSIHPSVGNWSFKCRSHYWIKQNQVEWAGDMTQAQIDEGRQRDRVAKDRHYGIVPPAETVDSTAKPSDVKQASGGLMRLFGRIRDWFS